MPVISVRSIIFAPMIFPRLNAEFPDNAEEIPTNNSGIEVANAIMINAAENSEIPKYLDMLLSDFTKYIPEIINAIAEIAK